jgi:hypothetical protein
LTADNAIIPSYAINAFHQVITMATGTSSSKHQEAVAIAVIFRLGIKMVFAGNMEIKINLKKLINSSRSYSMKKSSLPTSCIFGL